MRSVFDVRLEYISVGRNALVSWVGNDALSMFRSVCAYWLGLSHIDWRYPGVNTSSICIEWFNDLSLECQKSSSA